MIRPLHNQELLNSGIDPGIIALNFKSLEGDITHQYLLEDAIAKLGDGKQTPHSSQYVTSEVSKLFKRYAHTLNGGWWCSGVDPLNNYSEMGWGCFKPDSPRRDHETGKIIKYEHPPGTATRAFFLDVPAHVWVLISDRYNIPIDKYQSFCQWVKDHPQIPITITEGAKKAAALLSCGIVAIGLPGINNGYSYDGYYTFENGKKVKVRTGPNYLIPDLEHFANEGRHFNICFDNDEKPKTVENVKNAICQYSYLLSSKGCTTKVCKWEFKEKGIDDVLVKHGMDAVIKIIANSLTLNQFLVYNFNCLTYKVAVNLNQKYLGDIDIPELIKYLLIKSPKGTGKTESLIKIVDLYNQLGIPVIVLTHRVQLGEAICNRLGLPFVTEIRNSETGDLLGYGLCADSLHPTSQARFNADSFKNCVVVADEIEQVTEHLLNSSTEVKKHRTEIFNQLTILVKNARLIIGLDADLTNVAVDFVTELGNIKPIKLTDIPSGFEELFNNRQTANSSYLKQELIRELSEYMGIYLRYDEIEHIANKIKLKNNLQQSFDNVQTAIIHFLNYKQTPHIIVNNWSENQWYITNYDESNPTNFIAALCKAIENDERVYIAVDSQKTKGKYSTKNLETYFSRKMTAKLSSLFPGKKILRIDSETIADPTHPAYGCISVINDVVKDYDIVITSPSVSTGVSIDFKGHFTSVWGCFQGVMTENSVRQSLARVRENIPRHIWIAKCGLTQYGNGSSNIKSLLASNHKQFNAHINQLNLAGMSIDETELETYSIFTTTYAKIACRVNAAKSDYRNIILQNLAGEGHIINNKSAQEDDETIKAEIKENRDINYNQELEDTENEDITNMTDIDYEKLSNQKHKTQQERRKERKYKTKQQYGEVTKELLALDDDGFYGKILLHYYLTLGRNFVTAKDKKAGEKIKQSKAAYQPDFNKTQYGSKVKILEHLEVEEIITSGDELFNSHPKVKAIADKLRVDTFATKNHLGITITNNTSDITILKRVLKLIGHDTSEVSRGVINQETGKRERVYKIVCIGGDDLRNQIFAGWLERDLMSTEKVSRCYQSPTENVSLCYQMSASSNNKIINQPDIDITTDTENPPNTPQNCFVWVGEWVGGVVRTVERLSNGTYKAAVTLWNGMDRFICNESYISIC
ncbi:plasmid replication protein, CyRepA1 family [Trichormus sp. NMC-1]|uniref:plasmid replication protein, CyRepA1 family n=1 Tax=Trichormus sp. NMC-1 TaxID=1853259 RepID=UPI0008DBF416|nr:plasmid replication protein, CyRepA1 family [Trichormus sp. NMC-1]